MRRFNLLSMAALPVTAFLIGAPMQAAGPVYKSIQNGDSMWLNSYRSVSGGYVAVGLSAGQTKQPGQGESAYLSFSITRCDANGNCTQNSGGGTIPASALKGSASGRMTLEVDLAAVPGFSVSTCTWGSNQSGVCTYGVPSGSITATVTKNNVVTYEYNGRWSQRWPGYSVRQQGVSAETSADAEAVVLGVPVSGVGTTDAWLSNRHNVYMEFERNQ